MMLDSYHKPVVPHHRLVFCDVRNNTQFWHEEELKVVYIGVQKHIAYLIECLYIGPKLCGQNIPTTLVFSQNVFSQIFN